MKVIKIEKHGCNYIVGFEGGAVRHLCGSEIELQAWLEKKTKKKQKGVEKPIKVRYNKYIIKKRKEVKIMKMVIVKIGGVIVDKDCYSLAKIREIEKAGFTVESVK